MTSHGIIGKPSPLPSLLPKTPTIAIITGIVFAALVLVALFFAPHSAAILHTFKAHPLAFELGLGIPALIPLIVTAINIREYFGFKPGAVRAPEKKPTPPLAPHVSNNQAKRDKSKKNPSNATP